MKTIHNNYTVHYVVVFYIGPNRNYTSYQHLFRTDPLMMFRKHVDYVNSSSSHLQSATFVFNHDLDQQIKDQVDNFQNFQKPVEIHYFDGPGFSYGAWNEVIKKKINDYDYFFLIEDDYIPTRPDFYQPFVDRCNDRCPYVCSYVEEKSPGKFVASSSNAIIQAEQCRLIYSKYQDVFAELNCYNLPQAWHTQTNFLNFFTQEGYVMADVLDQYKTLHMLNCNINQLVSFGNANAPALIEPIIVPLV